MAAQTDFRRQDYIDSALRAYKYELEMKWDSAYRQGTQANAEPINIPELPNVQLVSRKQAAKLLAISPGTLDKFRREGELHPVKSLLPAIKFKLEDINRLIQAKRRR